MLLRSSLVAPEGDVVWGTLRGCSEAGSGGVGGSLAGEMVADLRDLRHQQKAEIASRVTSPMIRSTLITVPAMSPCTGVGARVVGRLVVGTEVGELVGAVVVGSAVGSRVGWAVGDEEGRRVGV